MLVLVNMWCELIIDHLLAISSQWIEEKGGVIDDIKAQWGHFR